MPTLFGARGMYRIGAVVLALWCGLLTRGDAHAATFHVNQYYVDDTVPNDFSDGRPGDGVAEGVPGTGRASLRACIEEANAHEGFDVIVFDGAGIVKPFTPLDALNDSTGGTAIIGNPNVTLDGEKMGTPLARIARLQAPKYTVSSEGELIPLEKVGTQKISADRASTKAPFVVTNANDAGAGSLRQAILDANITGETDTITFAGAFDIRPATELPAIKDGITIDGGGTVVLRGNQLAAGSGLTITGSGNTIRGLTIIQFIDNGIDIRVGTGNLIENCEIGTDGVNLVLGNGIGIQVASDGNTIQGANVISGNNGDGIRITNTGEGNSVFNNVIGTNLDGTLPLPNGGDGIAVFGDNNFIGTPGQGNRIAANLGNGIYLEALFNIINTFLISTADGNSVLGNVIGSIALDPNFANPGAGIVIEGDGNTIGGDVVGAGNFIVGNAVEGILVRGDRSLVERNSIYGNATDGIRTTLHIDQPPPNFPPRPTIRNTFTENSIYSNGELGINLDEDGTNQNIAAPVIVELVSISGTTVQLRGTAIPDDLIELFADTADEGELFVDAVRADGFTGEWSFDLNVADFLNFNSFTATATNGVGNTSEFSNVVLFGQYYSGLRIRSAFNEVRDLEIIRFPASGITIQSVTATSNTITGCTLGGAGGGNLGQGLTLLFGANDNLIGGVIPSASNLISANGLDGVLVFGPGVDANQILGNTIEGNANNGVLVGGSPSQNLFRGNTMKGNAFNGVLIEDGASGNLIGGTVPGQGNIILANGTSGVAVDGVRIEDPETQDNVIAGNFIGIDRNSAVSGNVGSGVAITAGAHDNLIGGTEPGARNVISGNGTGGVSGFGVFIFDADTTANQVIGNFIGTTVNGAAPAGNASGGVALYDGANDNIIGIPDAGNVISGNLGRGIDLDAVTGTSIQANYIGTSATGLFQIPNFDSGIAVRGDAATALIGGTGTGEGNVISGNLDDGIVIYDAGSGNRVLGNFIGTDATGTFAVGNSSMGVFITGQATDNVIGGSTAAARNVISGNGMDGVRIGRPNTSLNRVQGNYIGSNIDGSPLPNSSNGVVVAGGATNNLIGGPNAGEGNVITQNQLGVEIRGSATVRNMIQANSIYSNADKGIALNLGGNADMPAPELTGIGPVRGNTLRNSRVDLFVDSEDEGQIFLDSVVANSGGLFSIDLDLAGFTGLNLTATATFLYSNGDGTFSGDTSAFSDVLPLAAPGILEQPVEVIVVEGDPFQLAMAATGTPTLSYQWQFSADGSEGAFENVPAGGNFGGTTTPTLQNSASILDDRGFYRCVVTNAIDATPTRGVLVTVVAADLNTAAVNTLADVVDGNTNSFAHAITFPGADGKISLRELMLASNNMPGPNTVNFGIAGTILLNSGLPALTDTTGPTTIDGNNGITVDGGNLEGNINGFTLPTWDNVLTGLNVVGMPANGILIEGANAAGNEIMNCRVGNDGQAANPNGASGILLRNGAHDNFIGGLSEGSANVLSGNVQHGVRIRDAGTEGNVILGNYIGTDAVGTAPLPNGVDGIRVELGATGTVIGGLFPGARNVISGNTENGVTVSGVGTADTRILGNYIGTDVTGDNAVGNGEHGVFATNGSEDSLIGGIQPGAANILSGNGLNGVRISGADTMRHRIRRNSIFQNGDSGILLEDGANEDMPPPRIIELGSVRGTAEPNAVVDLFVNPTDTDEAKTLLGSATANGSGAFFFDIDLTAYVTMTLTATATDAAGNTSALSNPKVVDLDPPVITINGSPLIELECSVEFYDELGAGALDDVDGDISGFVVITVTRDGVPVPAVDTTVTGTYLVAYNVTDISGKAAETAIRTVRVQDTIPPQLSLLGSNSVLLECADVYNDAGAAAFDICAGNITGAIVVSNTVDTGSPGAYTVSYTVSDAAGNLAAPVSRSVRVLDRVAPVITISGPDPLTMTVFGTYTEPGVSATDGCDEALPPVASDTGGLNTRRPGAYTVNYHVSDASGNTDTASRTVIVVDDVRPELTLNGQASVLLDCGDAYEELGAAALDNLDGDISGQVQISGAVDSHATGVYTLRYDVTDNAGNAANPVTRVVEVRDNIVPEITLLGGATLNLACNGIYSEPGFIAEDGCDGDLTDVVSVQNPVDSAVPGRYNVRYFVTDAGGNRGQAVRTVIVQDCPGDCVVQCEGAADQTDNDNDTLNACAEECLGTSDQALDTDLDGMPDPYEVAMGTNPVVPDADVDLDGDVLTNLDEYLRNGQPDDSNSPERTVFVAPGADEATANGALDHPFATINAALANIHPTFNAPVRVVLAPGVYVEDVTLVPWVTLAGSLEGEARIEGQIVGAQGAGLEHLTLVAFTEDDLLLFMNNVKMHVSHVWFAGGAPLPATGIVVLGQRSFDSVIEDRVFAQIGTGIDISGSIPMIRRCIFQELSMVGILFRESADIEGGRPVGEEGAFESGWNTFDPSMTGFAVVNLGDQTAVMELNDWGTDDEADIAARIDGPGDVDFRPFLSAGTGADAATLHVVLLAEGTNNRLGEGAVTLEESGLTASAEQNVYNFPVISGGVHTIRAEVSRFQTLTVTVFVESGRNTAITLSLKPVPKRGPFRCGGEAPGEDRGLGGDLLVMVLFTAVLFWQTPRLARRSSQRS